MIDPRPKILLFDTSEIPTHMDSLYSHCLLLKKDWRIFTLLPESYKLNLSDQYPIERSFFFPFQKGRVGALNMLSYARKIQREVNPDLIYMSSAQGTLAQLFCLSNLCNRIPFAGLHHNPAKLLSGGSQTTINLKIKNYWVLAEYITQNLNQKLGGSPRVHTFRAPFMANPLIETQTSFSSERIYVGIPGTIEQSRRDYSGFLKFLSKNESHIHSNIHFVLAGPAHHQEGKEYLQEIERLNLRHRFTTFDHFLSFTELFQTLRKCSAILTLIHPGQTHFEEYKETKISGAYLQAWAFGIPLLQHESFKGLPDFQKDTHFYNLEQLTSVLNSLPSRKSLANSMTEDELKAALKDDFWKPALNFSQKLTDLLRL